MSTRAVISRNAAWAIVNLGISRAEFMRTSPAEMDEVVAEFKKKQRRDDAWMAKLCWVVAMSAGVKLPKPGTKIKRDPLALPPEFFAPWYVHPVAEKRRRKMNPFDALIAMMGPGRVIDLRPKKPSKGKR